jgi:uncharacterized protein YjbI with pentapeptide repeats
VDFRFAGLQKASLAGAHLQGADLDGSHLEGAVADDRTAWPAGFNWHAAGVATTTAK